MHVGESSIVGSTSTGFPQGGVCSALFWVIAFDPAIKILNKHNVIGNGFADDCAAVIGGSSIKTMVGKLQKVVNELVAWGEKCGLKFNASKTAAIHFTRRQKEAEHWLLVNGKKIEYSDSTKYLGVILDLSLIHI